MQLNDDALDKTLSFETLIGQRLKNLVFTDILSASTVSALGEDPAAKHQTYRPYFPSTVPNDYRQYKYAKFVDATGKAHYYGIPWIKEASIVTNDSPAKRYTFPTLTADEERSLTAMITASGIENFTVETI